jgi:hypothetical protein
MAGAAWWAWILIGLLFGFGFAFGQALGNGLIALIGGRGKP